MSDQDDLALNQTYVRILSKELTVAKKEISELKEIIAITQQALKQIREYVEKNEVTTEDYAKKAIAPLARRLERVQEKVIDQLYGLETALDEQYLDLQLFKVNLSNDGLYNDNEEQAEDDKQ